MDEIKSYNTKYPNIKIQRLDMGIAMCHFELTANEQGLNGSWNKDGYESGSDKLIYIASWVGE